MWSSLASAIRFLTIIPLPTAQPTGEASLDYSILYYPLVGLLIGLVLLATEVVCGMFSAPLQALCIVAVWAVITGGLHLDGLADTADAWLGGHGDRERTLAILRDTSVGVAAVIAIVLILAFKIMLLAELQTNQVAAVLIAPVIGRTMVMLLFNTTPYVREQGIASALIATLPRQRIYLIVLAVMLIVLGVLGLAGLLMLSCVFVGFLLLRYLFMQRLGGTTGDTAGALIEISEVLVLFGLVLSEKWL